MAAFSSQASDAAPATPAQRTRFVVPEMWASLAIAVIWVVVLVDALVGPDIVANDAGGNFTRVPSAIVIAFFAWLATWVIARRGFGNT